mgnify:CR=1 FL=1
MSITTVLVAGLLLFVGGGVTGWAVARERTADVIEAQSEMIGQIQETQRETLEAVARPITMDAELRAQLGAVPPSCVKVLGGDPMSPTCLLSQCWQFGQSTANRPECRKIEELVLERMACPETQSTGGQ